MESLLNFWERDCEVDIAPVQDVEEGISTNPVSNLATFLLCLQLINAVVNNDQGRDNCEQLATVTQCQKSRSSTAQNDDVGVVTHDGPVDVPLDDNTLVVDMPLDDDALDDVPLNDDAPVVDMPLDDDALVAVPINDGAPVVDVPVDKDAPGDVPLDDVEQGALERGVHVMPW